MYDSTLRSNTRYKTSTKLHYLNVVYYKTAHLLQLQIKQIIQQLTFPHIENK